LDTTLTPALKREGAAREVIRYIQSERKKAQLLVNDRILLSLSTPDDELRQAITEHRESISTETLATGLIFDQTYTYEANVVVVDAPLTVSFQKS
jgi:isoleucyl-tRNA synthetase